MKKKLAVFMIVVIALASFSAGVMSKGIIETIEAELRGDFTVYIDGVKQSFRDADGKKVEPILYEGTTYLPVRAIGEIMGKTVYWYQAEKKIDLVTPSGEASLVTDADIIVEGDKKAEAKKVKEQKPAEEKVTEAVITLDEAKSIALEKAGVKEKDVIFTKARLERDDGVQVYDIEFFKDGIEYEAEIRASDGRILEWDSDRD